MTMGERLAGLRKKNGLSQDALAEALGVSRQSVSKWETDASAPDLDKLVKLSDLFEVSLDELVKGKAAISAVPSPEADTTAMRFHYQKIAGSVLLACIGAAILFCCVGSSISGDLLFSYCIPLLICALFCLFVKHSAILLCCWTLWVTAFHFHGWALAGLTGQSEFTGNLYIKVLKPSVFLLVSLVLLFLWTLCRPPKQWTRGLIWLAVSFRTCCFLNEYAFRAAYAFPYVLLLVILLIIFIVWAVQILSEKKKSSE